MPSRKRYSSVIKRLGIKQLPTVPAVNEQEERVWKCHITPPVRTMPVRFVIVLNVFRVLNIELTESGPKVPDVSVQRPDDLGGAGQVMPPMWHTSQLSDSVCLAICAQANTSKYFYSEIQTGLFINKMFTPMKLAF